MTRLNKKLIWTILLGLTTITILSLAADFRETAEALKQFRLVFLPLIVGLTFINYLLRFVKWQYFLKVINIELELKDSFKIFLSGLAMAVTPGKVGELLKSVLLKELKGVPVSRTAPVIFAERLSDGFGLIILSLSGMAMFRYGKEVLLGVALVMALLVLVIRTPRFYRPLIGLCSRMPAANRFTRVFETLLESAGELLTFRSLLFTVAISVISWSFECIAFYYVFVGLGYKVPLLAATFTLAFSSVVGAVSMLPGGLGAAEGSIMGLLVKVVGVPAGTAAVATIIIRFSTLWFGVVVGLAAMVTSRRFIGIMSDMEGTPDEKGAVN